MNTSKNLITHEVKENSIDTFSDLRNASKRIQLVNLVTLYRIIAFPFLLTLIFTNHIHIFKWLLIISFLTDMADGFLARKFKATTILGARLDSIGDNLTIIAAMVGLVSIKFAFIKAELVVFLVLGILFLLQVLVAMIRYKKITSFHTYLAKLAAMLQGIFLCSMFLFDKPLYWLFYTASFVTGIELIEETILVFMLPKWKANVKGLYWVKQK